MIVCMTRVPRGLEIARHGGKRKLYGLNQLSVVKKGDNTILTFFITSYKLLIHVLTNWQDCLILTVDSTTVSKITILVLLKLKMKMKRVKVS